MLRSPGSSARGAAHARAGGPIHGGSRRGSELGSDADSGAAPETDDGLDFEDVGPTVISGEHDTAPADDAPGDLVIAPGRVLGGRYLLERELGRGGNGVVFEALDRASHTRIAIKCLHPHVASSTVNVQRLLREARISAEVQHPSVIRTYDVARERDVYYLTMELLRGETLAALITRGPHPVPEIQRIFLAVLDGVAAVHTMGVVHRDLKPDNVFLVPDDDGVPHPKVVDFGLSKLHDPDSPGLTNVGMAMGTPHYMAPEQIADSRRVDERADVYALGIMLYEALSGAVPYSSDNMLELFGKAFAGKATPLREVRPDVPAPLEALVARAMSPKAEDRFSSVGAMRDALAASLDEASGDDWGAAALGGPLDDLPAAPTVVMAPDLPDPRVDTIPAPPMPEHRREVPPPPRSRARLAIIAGVGAGLFVLGLASTIVAWLVLG